MNMSEIEKVTKGFECCIIDETGPNCEACPYADQEEGTCVKLDPLFRDALDVLERFKPVEPGRDGSDATWWYICGACKTAINPNDKFCHECGAEVKWGMMCPRCKSKSVDVHPIDLTQYHWYLCFDCNYVWNDPGYDELLKAREKNG